MRRLIIPALAVIGIGVAFAVQQQAGAQKGSASAADDEPLSIERMPEELAARMAARERMLTNLGLRTPDVTEKGVFMLSALWGPSYEKLNVCFLAKNSTPAIRTMIANIAREWNKDVPGLMPLNFGIDPSKPDVCPGQAGPEKHQIRVSIEPTDSWSLTGSLSVREAGQNEASMNFNAKLFTSTRKADDPYLRQTVLHEFGHALGLEHEHQHPAGACQKEFDVDAIMRSTGWSRAIVEEQMLAQLTGWMKTTTFDPNSVMLYALPASYFKAGSKKTCLHERNTKLSAGDKTLIAEVYPADKSARIAFAKGHKENRQTAARRANLPADKMKSAGDVIEEYFREAPQ